MKDAIIAVMLKVITWLSRTDAKPDGAARRG